MTRIRFLLPGLFGIGVLLTSCERRESAEDGSHQDAGAAATKPSETTPDNLPPSSSGSSWREKFDAGNLVRSGREITDKYSAEAEKALNQWNVKDLKSRAEGLGKAINSGDFAEAQVIADKLGKALDSDRIGMCVKFFRIKSEHGSKAAQEEIRKYMDSVTLTSEEKKVFENLHAYIATMDAEATINVVAMITAIACEAKLGHGGAAIGGLLGEILKEAFQVNRKTQHQESPVNKAMTHPAER